LFGRRTGGHSGEGLPHLSAGRRAFSRTSRSLSVMRSVSWRVSGRWWTVR